MVAPEPDVGLLTSSAQIFASNHTLPQIRQIHKALLVQVDDKAARLRTQVGGSYRELLGTADTIVQMRSDMEAAQTTLAGMGGRCGRAVVGGKVSALASFVQAEQEQASSLSLMARAKLLEACARTVSRLLSRKNNGGGGSRQTRQYDRQQQQQQQQSWGERLVLASKVLVLSRLLISSIDESESTAKSKPKPPRPAGPHHDSTDRLQDSAVLASIDASKRTLGNLRRRLRDIIEIVERTVPSSSSSAAAAKQATGNNDSESDDEGRLRGTATSASTAAAATALDDLLRALCAHSLATTSGARDLLWQLLHVRSQAMALAFELGDDDEYNDDNSSSKEGAGAGAGAGTTSWKADNVLRGLALYTRTLLDVQALLPHKLPDALLGLKRRALLDDADLRQIEGLRLDVYARWCGEDVQYFKPYIRHDDLDAAQAREMLSTWAERGSGVLLAGLQRALEQGNSENGNKQQKTQQQQQQPATRAHRASLDLDAIVDLRTRVLQLWIRDSSKARGIDPSELLEKMRDVFNQQLLHVVSTKVAKLRLVGSEMAATIASMSSRQQDSTTTADRRHASLWGGDLDTDLHHHHHHHHHHNGGAVAFVRDVTARLHGRSNAVAKAAASYATWRRVVDDVNTIVEQLRRQRWDNDVDDIVEDEETLAERQQLLSRQDPQTLHDHLAAALEAAFQELNTHVVAEWTKVAAANSSSSSSSGSDATKGHIAAYLIRVLRELRSNRPSVGGGSGSSSSGSGTASSSAAINALGLEIIPALHAAVARVVVAGPLEKLTSQALTRKTVAGRALWDGQGQGQQPPLPPTPSPGVFKFLRDLSASMGEAGLDLWSPAALVQLKKHVAMELGKQWKELLETADYLQPGKAAEGGDEEKKSKSKSDDNDDDDDDDSDGGDADDNTSQKDGAASAAVLSKSDRRDLLTQWLFDIAWLRCSLDVPIASADRDAPQPLAALEDAVYDQSGLQESEGGAGKTPRQRVNKAAQEYWKKTSLLFGLLA